jgi:hypothetical protein
MITDWTKVLYEGCCPLGKLCAKHLIIHQRACAGSPCDVCKAQPKRQ